MRNKEIFDFTDYSQGLSYLQDSRGIENLENVEEGNFVLVKDIFNQNFYIKLCQVLPHSVSGWLGIISSNIREDDERKPYKFGMLCFVDETHFLDFSEEMDQKKEQSQTFIYENYNILDDYMIDEDDEEGEESSDSVS